MFADNSLNFIDKLKQFDVYRRIPNDYIKGSRIGALSI